MSSLLRRLLPSRKGDTEETATAIKTQQHKPSNVESPVGLRTVSECIPESQHQQAALEPALPSSSQPRPPSPARKFPSSGFHNFSKFRRIEEENYSWYSTKNFYPVHIGELIRERYQVITKLGYGTSSTSWLCRDLRSVKSPERKISKPTKLILRHCAGPIDMLLSRCTQPTKARLSEKLLRSSISKRL